MKEKKLRLLPLGNSDFEKIVREDLVYVDKTELIHKMKILTNTP